MNTALPSETSVIVFATLPVVAVLLAFTSLVLKTVLAEWELVFYGAAVLFAAVAVVVHVIGTRRIIRLISAAQADEIRRNH
ncbi:hypothetical protein [Microbacterium sp. NPDC055665]